MKGWNIDLKTLYGRKWNDKVKFHQSENLWESPRGNVACVFFGIGEVGVSKEVGYLAIFQNKENPKLILPPPNLPCWHLYEKSVQFTTENLFFVHRFRSGKKILGVELYGIDVTAKSLRFVRQLEGYFYDVRSIDGMNYGFKKMVLEGTADEIVIDLSDIPEKPISRWY